MSLSIRKNKDYSNDRELSRQSFNFVLGTTIAYGFLANLLIVYFLSDFIMANIPFVVAGIGYLVLALVGVLLMRFFRSPIISFIGYNMLVIPAGVILAYSLPSYAISSILIACVITFSCTIIMMIAAMIKPDFFLGLGRTLFLSLCISLVIEIILFFLGVDLGIMDWIVGIIFCGYIGFDWARVNSYGVYTLDFAIDEAAEFYLDILNLFLRILNIFGSSDD